MSRIVIACAAALALLAAACGSGGGAASSSEGAPAGRITVFAASSLTDVFRAAGEAFTKANSGATVEFNFQSSSALLTQLEQGAHADVFATADRATMQRAVDRGLVEGTPVSFARNRPVIVVPATRAAVAVPNDLAGPGTKLVLASPDVPIGAYARQVIDRLAADPAYGPAFRAAVLKNIVSNESNVRAVLTKVELGEADAGIVYRTDALAAGAKVRTIAIPEAATVVAEYPVALVRLSANRSAAAAFISFLVSTDGRRILTEAGFEPAP